ncbi:hypothetical protein SDC9_97342 [bioreactor metagenome]|uniref:PTS EIIA type-4 domain-containing protein n=1 Tax=bioreactor metagenome TaxID=1076179 RepID=A0A645ABQ4_9ZZZZ|nr:hypothetical protein [Erysipelotrichaceae bacterium]
MRKICILTHGLFARGIQQSLTIFLGSDHHFDAISAYVDEDLQVKDQIADYLKGVKAEDQLILLTDIMGGSVNTMVMPLLKRPNTYIIAGINFPLLLQLSALPDDADLPDFINLVEQAQKSIVLLNNLDFSQFTDDNDE